jgi:DNA-binding NarL/FixJ family response regulator
VSSRPLSVIVAEDQALLRLGMVQVLRSAGYSIAAETTTGDETLAQAESLRPEVILLKKDIPGLDGVRCSRALRSSLGSSLAILMLLGRADDFWEALDSGANGFALRETHVDLLPYAVKQVNSGLGWIGPNISQYLVMGNGLPILRGAANRFANAQSLSALTDREQDVIHLLVEGASNQQIAQSLGLKLQTVKVHVKNILRKLNAESRAQAISLVLNPGGPRR